MPKQTMFEVRDLRLQEWLWTSKSLLFSESVDEKMYKVYSGLAAYANNQTQKAFPSIDTLKDKLHMGRNTVIRALQALEAGGFISVERVQGQNNIYILLEVGQQAPTVRTHTEPVVTTNVPATRVKDFFKGVQDLREKNDTPEAAEIKQFLLQLKERYPAAPKDAFWNEIIKFERYWTELNATGTKQRWQKQPTFEVDRRLVTWFSKKDQFVTAGADRRPVKRMV